jgi:protein SCO1/2
MGAGVVAFAPGLPRGLDAAGTPFRSGRDGVSHAFRDLCTVDPKRDTLPVLADYVANFSPRMVGLRGTDDQLAALARRYRLVYSVTPAAPGQAYEVTHSAAIYVFDGSGAARLLIPDLAAAGASMEGTATDLKRLIAA